MLVMKLTADKITFEVLTVANVKLTVAYDVT
jgi:hypothetical protein